MKKETYEIILSEMVTGRYVYDAGDIAVVWDRKSFMLSDNVEFRIILVEQLPKGEKRRTDVTEDYILSIPATQGHPNKDNTLITFNGVRISLGRRITLTDVREQVVK